MIGWLRRLFVGSRDEKSPVQPLRFQYASADGTASRVHLHDWTSDGVYVVGQSLTHNRRMTYRLDRITVFHDLSYRQIKGYRPRAGSPLDPRRLP